MAFQEVRRTLQNAVHGNYRLLYVSPERLESELFREYLPALKIGLIAVDEAHCISQWGFDFRPSYRRIATLRAQLHGVPVLALTASATRLVQDDICVQLAFGPDAKRFQQSFERPNLSYSALEVHARPQKLLDIFRNVAGTGIVYCKSRRHTREVASLLQQSGISAAFYHAGLNGEERTSRQDDWVNNRIRVMVCTNAFGMGIDKPDVRVVVHYDVPDSPENYYQEAGRAGRDGKRAYAVLLYNSHELNQLEAQPAIRYPTSAQIREVYMALMNYLQVPAGYGEGQRYNFDLSGFIKAFSLPVLTATYALQQLEQEGLILMGEGWKSTSTVMITGGRAELEELEQLHPRLDEVMKALLRSYEGVLDFPAAVRESELARFARLPKDELELRLQELHRMGWIEYVPSLDAPQVILLRNRMYNDSILFRLEYYEERKKQCQERVAAMIAYASMANGCRSRYLAGYFSAEVADCGICDNCLQANREKTNHSDFEKVAIKLRAEVAKGSLLLTDLLSRVKGAEKEKMLEVISYLQEEGRLRINESGELIINNV
jgi:ATP-dependent DNA helicase RecQ